MSDVVQKTDMNEVMLKTRPKFIKDAWKSKMAEVDGLQGEMGMGNSSKTIVLHFTMYFVSMMTEISQLKSKYKMNRYPVFYFSQAASTCQLFVEFIFQLMNEHCEPLMVLIEIAKAGLRFKEYAALVKKEGIKLYIEQSEYKEHKEISEIKQTHYKLSMTKKQVPKIKNFMLPDKLKQIREKGQNQVNNFDNESLGSVAEDAASPSRRDRVTQNINDAIRGQQKQSKNSGVLNSFQKLMRKIANGLYAQDY
jgi:hypothetical protein